MVSGTDYAAEEVENSSNDKWLETWDERKESEKQKRGERRSEREDDGKSFNSQSALAYR